LVKKSPFKGLWNYKGDANTMVVTNIEQVFPFTSKFKNKNFKDSDIYEAETIIFKDPTFGESFVYAVLTYEPKKFYLTNFFLL